MPFLYVEQDHSSWTGNPHNHYFGISKCSFGISKRLLTLLIVCEKMQLWLPKAVASSCHVTPAPKSGAWAWWKRSQRVMADFQSFHFMAALKPKETIPGWCFRFEENGRRVETGNQATTFRWKDTKTLKQNGQQWHKLWQSWQAVAQKTAGDVWAWHFFQKLQEAPYYLTANDHIFHPVNWRIQNYKFKIILKLETLTEKPAARELVTADWRHGLYDFGSKPAEVDEVLLDSWPPLWRSEALRDKGPVG